MSKRFLVSVVVLTASFTCASALAAGPGGLPGGRGAMPPSPSHLGAPPAPNPPTPPNSNSPRSPERETGLARAKERRSAKGNAHEKADLAHAKPKRVYKTYAAAPRSQP
jgi:hypothetical protein